MRLHAPAAAAGGAAPPVGGTPPGGLSNAQAAAVAGAVAEKLVGQNSKMLEALTCFAAAEKLKAENVALAQSGTAAEGRRRRAQARVSEDLTYDSPELLKTTVCFIRACRGRSASDEEIAAWLDTLSTRCERSGVRPEFLQSVIAYGKHHQWVQLMELLFKEGQARPHGAAASIFAPQVEPLLQCGRRLPREWDEVKPLLQQRADAGMASQHAETVRALESVLHFDDAMAVIDRGLKHGWAPSELQQQLAALTTSSSPSVQFERWLSDPVTMDRVLEGKLLIKDWREEVVVRVQARRDLESAAPMQPRGETGVSQSSAPRPGEGGEGRRRPAEHDPSPS
eukprot:gene32419-36944_t